MAKIPDGICQCGCGGRTNLAPRNIKAKGIVKGEPYRFIMGHGGARGRGKGARPLEKCYEVDTNGCWVWLLFKNPKGYGTISRKGVKNLLAHRYVYEQLVGPIPDGLVIDHLCCNPACVNPSHLEPVTAKENNRRQHARRQGS